MRPGSSASGEPTAICGGPASITPWTGCRFRTEGERTKRKDKTVNNDQNELEVDRQIERDKQARCTEEVKQYHMTLVYGVYFVCFLTMIITGFLRPLETVEWGWCNRWLLLWFVSISNILAVIAKKGSLPGAALAAAIIISYPVMLLLRAMW